MKDITVLLYWTNMREITSYWFDVLRVIMKAIIVYYWNNKYNNMENIFFQNYMMQTITCNIRFKVWLWQQFRLDGDRSDVLRVITSYWFDVQKRANFKQLVCATCRFPHSHLTYVQFAAGIMSYFLFHGIKL
jgi:hypothetical protein